MQLSKLVRTGYDKVRLAHWNCNDYVKIEDKNNVLFSLMKRKSGISINELTCNNWEPLKNN